MKIKVITVLIILLYFISNTIYDVFIKKHDVFFRDYVEFLESSSNNKRFMNYILVIVFWWNLISIFLDLKYKVLIIPILFIIYLSFWPILYVFNMIFELFISNEPFVEIYDELKGFEKNYKVIKPELDALYDEFAPKCIKDVNPGFTIGTDDDKCWRIINIKYLGKFVDSIDIDKYPQLKKTLNDPMIYNAFFSILDPRVNIPVHRGYYKGFLRYHIGYKIPEGSFISVNDIKYKWKEGKGVMFDDMYKHYVENNSDETRIVIYCDIKRKLPLPLHVLNSIYTNVLSEHFILKRLLKNDHKTKNI